MRTSMLSVLALLMFVGCSHNDRPSAISALSSDSVDELNASHSQFDASKDPKFKPQTRYAAGQLAESQGRPDIALAQYAQALKIDRNHQPSLFRIGVIHTRLGHFPQAIEAWKAYIKATKYSATAYANLAFCYEQAQRPGDAETTYKMGIKQDPKSQPCRINYGLMLARQGRIDEATAQLGAVLSPAEVHYNLASVYEQQGKTEQARAEYERALELDPKLWEAQSRLAKLD